MLSNNREYLMGGIKLQSVCEEQDPGGMVDSSKKFSDLSNFASR